MPDNELPKIPEQTTEAMAEREDYEKIRAELTQNGLDAEAYTDEFLNWMKNEKDNNGNYPYLGTYDDLMELATNSEKDNLNDGYHFNLDVALRAYEQAQTAAPAAPVAPTASEAVKNPAFDALVASFKNTVEAQLKTVAQTDKTKAENLQKEFDAAVASGDIEKVNQAYKKVGEAFDVAAKAQVAPAAPEAAAPKSPEQVQLEKFENVKNALDPAVTGPDGLLSTLEKKNKTVADKMRALWQIALDSKNPENLQATYTIIAGVTQDTPQASITPEAPKAPEQLPSERFENVKKALDPAVTGPDGLLSVLEKKDKTVADKMRGLWQTALDSKNPENLQATYTIIAGVAQDTPQAPAPDDIEDGEDLAERLDSVVARKLEAIQSFAPGSVMYLRPEWEATKKSGEEKVKAFFNQICWFAEGATLDTAKVDKELTQEDALKSGLLQYRAEGWEPKNGYVWRTPDNGSTDWGVKVAPVEAPSPTPAPAPEVTAPTAPDAAAPAPAPGPDATTPDSNPIDIWGTGVQDNLQNIRKLDPARADALAKEWEDIKAAGDQAQALAKANEITKESQKTLESLSHVGERLSEVDAVRYGLIEKRVDDNNDGTVDDNDNWYPKLGLDWIDPNDTTADGYGVKFKEGSADEATAGEPATPGAAAPGDTGSTGGSSPSGSRERRETVSEVDFKGALKANPDKYVKQETVDGKTKVTLTDVPDRGSRIQHIVGPDGVIKIEADELATTVLTAGGTEYRWDGSSWSNGGRRLYIGESYAKEFTISGGAPVSVGGSSSGSAGAEKAPEKEASSELLIALPGKPDTYQAAKDIDNLATMVPSIDKYLGLRGRQKLPNRVEKDGVTYTLVRGENVKSDETGDTATHPGAPVEYRSASGVLKIKQGETFKVYFDATPAAAPERAPEGNSLQKGMQTLIERVIVMPGKEKELVKNVNAKLTGKTFKSLTFKDAQGMGQTVTLTVSNPDGTEKTYTGDTGRTVGVNAIAGNTPNPFGGAEIQMNAWNRDALRNLFEKIASAA